MERLRTLLLARTHMVVMDADVVAGAATRPTRDVDAEKLEDELAQLGFVMSLDLAMTLRRLPYQAILELRDWILATLAPAAGEPRPRVPLAPARPAPLPADAPSVYLRRMTTWLHAAPAQPCPWCGALEATGALEPCGHLVCRTCWDSVSHSGCPICHRRATLGRPAARDGAEVPRIEHHAGTLTLLHLAVDLVGTAKLRFAGLVARPAPLTPPDRAELETLIDAVGPRVLNWLPSRIPVRETMALAVARLWLVAADRAAMVRATAAQIETATDVARIALVLMGGEPVPGTSRRLTSLGRGLRRAILEALDRLPPAQVAEEMSRHRSAWKRIGERLHPFEWADRLPHAALAFALVRQTTLVSPSLENVRRAAAAAGPAIRITNDRARPVAWAAPVEQALRDGNPRGALARLTHRSEDLVRRADHLVRVAQARQPEGLSTILKAIELATAKVPPQRLLALARHVARRGVAWPRRVFGATGANARVWAAEDHRPPLPHFAIEAIVRAVHHELFGRAELLRHYPRAVIDRALEEVLLPNAAGTSVTVWDLACIHAAARANVIYVRERDQTFTTYRRRDGEAATSRLARLVSGTSDDGRLDAMPAASAPTWIAVLRLDLALPKGSAGYVHDRGAAPGGAQDQPAGEDLVRSLDR